MTDQTWLLLCAGTLITRAYKVKTRRQLLGRSVECDFHIVHETVSRRHAEIWRQKGKIYVRDLKSRNGTFVDDEPITDSVLVPGNTLRLGKVSLRVVSRTILIAMYGGDNQKPTAAVDPEPPESDDSNFGGLSSSQLQVLRLLLNGLPEKKVAASLGLSRHTVHTHVKHIYQQLRVRSRAELLALYISKPALEV